LKVSSRDVFNKQGDKQIGDQKQYGHVWSAYECDRHKTELTDSFTDTDEI